MIYNEFIALGPNTTGYPGGYPNGYLPLLRRRGWWGARRLHLCSGSVRDGVTVDIKPELRPTAVCDLSVGVPFKDRSFDTVLIDAPYSEKMAGELYGLPLLSVPKLLVEAERVVEHDGLVIALDWTVWPPRLWAPRLCWVALCAIYIANPGPKPLRALQVWRKMPKPLEEWDGSGPDDD